MPTSTTGLANPCPSRACTTLPPPSFRAGPPVGGLLRNRDQSCLEWRDLPGNAIYNRHRNPAAGRVTSGWKEEHMGRIFKAVIFLAILAAIAVVGYAYLGDMAPRQQEQRLEVDLNGAN
jgi:hypothetical protein